MADEIQLNDRKRCTGGGRAHSGRRSPSIFIPTKRSGASLAPSSASCCCSRCRVAESLKLPGDGAAESVLGVSEDDLRQFALAGLTRRLAIIGVPIDSL